MSFGYNVHPTRIGCKALISSNDVIYTAASMCVAFGLFLFFAFLTGAIWKDTS